jgi:uncharacterized membrane protein required for colicin V production
MDIGTMDIFLLVAIASTLVVGFFWGAARSVMLLAAWLLAFLAGAYLKLELGSYLANQWANFPATFSEMAAFGIIYLGLLLAAPIIIVLATRANGRVSRYQVLDDAVGAVFAVFVAVLGIAGLMIVLSTFYGPDGTEIGTAGGPEWMALLYQDLLNSSIGRGINEHLVPLIGAILGPILPADVREVFA